MSITPKGIRLFAAMLPLFLLLGCETGGDAAQGSAISVDIPPGDQGTKPNAAPVAITHDNAKDVAGSALKSVLLSSMSANALNSAVTVTREQNDQLAELATGVVITLRPVGCLYEGSFTMQARLESTGEDIQIDPANRLDMAFNTRFDQCNQGLIKLDGMVAIAFSAIINELIDTNNFTLDTHASVAQLAIQQPGFNPFVVNGSVDYLVTSPDGETIITDIYTDDLSYAADNTYQIFDFETHKRVHLPTGAYTYDVYSQFVDEMHEGRMVEYQTLEPLRGTGSDLPYAGTLIVFGETSTMEIDVLDSELIELKLDYGNDSTIDEIVYSTWHELAVANLAIY